MFLPPFPSGGSLLGGGSSEKLVWRGGGAKGPFSRLPHPTLPNLELTGAGREVVENSQAPPRGSPQQWAGELPLPLDTPHLYLCCRALRHGEGSGCAPSCGPRYKVSSHLATNTTRRHLLTLSRVCPQSTLHSKACFTFLSFEGLFMHIIFTKPNLSISLTVSFLLLLVSHPRNHCQI